MSGRAVSASSELDGSHDEMRLRLINHIEPKTMVQILRTCILLENLKLHCLTLGSSPFKDVANELGAEAAASPPMGELNLIQYQLILPLLSSDKTDVFSRDRHDLGNPGIPPISKQNPLPRLIPRAELALYDLDVSLTLESIRPLTVLFNGWSELIVHGRLTDPEFSCNTRLSS